MTRQACGAALERGGTCRAFALPSGRCWNHAPERAAERHVARAKGGKLKALQGRRKRLDSPSAVVAFLSGLVHDLVDGQRDADTVRTVAYSLSVQLKALELARQVDVEQALAEVERLTRQARRA